MSRCKIVTMNRVAKLEFGNVTTDLSNSSNCLNLRMAAETAAPPGASFRVIPTFGRNKTGGGTDAAN